MGATNKIRNAVRGFLQYYGTGKVKSRLWDAEFAQGRWDCLESTPGDCVYPFIEKYANQGSILDLGCGSGSTGNEVAASAYRDYIGVDISEVAIGKAKAKSEENCRGEKNRFFQFDIASYAPAQQFDVILFRDTIYYLPTPNIPPILERYSRHLKAGGVFIVRVWDGKDKQRNIVKVIEKNFQVVEKFAPAESSVVVLVFQRRASQ
jgi:SAM-dependent methyltransferase